MRRHLTALGFPEPDSVIVAKTPTGARRWRFDGIEPIGPDVLLSLVPVPPPGAVVSLRCTSPPTAR